MGSLNAAGIPVPGKTPMSFRKMDIRITRSSGTNVVENVTTNRPELGRTIGSGCIVRDNGVADCFETVAWGIQYESRSTSARIARDGARDLSVNRSGVVVIPTSLAPDTPQTSVRSFGTHIDRRNSVTDEQIDSVPSSGIFPPPPW